MNEKCTRSIIISCFLMIGMNQNMFPSHGIDVYVSPPNSFFLSFVLRFF